MLLPIWILDPILFHLFKNFSPLKYPLYSAPSILLCSEITYDFGIAKPSSQFSVLIF